MFIKEKNGRHLDISSSTVHHIIKPVKDSEDKGPKPKSPVMSDPSDSVAARPVTHQ